MKALADRLQKVRQELTRFPEWANVALGNQALIMLRQRIVKKGIAADDAPYKPYSSSPMFVGAKSFRTKAQATAYFGGKGKAGKDKRRAMQWRTLDRGGSMYKLAILPGGYRQLRKLVGAESNFKNFTWSGEMWKSIHTLGTRSEGEYRFVTTVGSEVELSNKKLEGHFKREGKEILMVSKKEEKALTDILDKYITNLLTKAING
jgi:hypothetical protein